MDRQKQPILKLQHGDQVEGKFDFVATTEDDLSFKKREPLTIIKDCEDPMWYYASNNSGRKGMVPTNYLMKVVPIETEIWYHGQLSRPQAEDLLSGTVDGTFLVRDSSTYTGDYTLCVSCSGKIEHYHVMKRGSKFTLDEELFFRTVALMVQFFKSSEETICCPLSAPVCKGRSASGKRRMLSISRDQVFRLSQAHLAVMRSQVEILEVIGHGEFGEVHKGRFKDMDVAVKSLIDNSAVQDFLHEASIMGSLHHPNLVNLLGVVTDEPVCLLTEFMTKGSLINWLRTRGRSISQANQLKFAVDTCAGMKYLEAKGVVHRDLAARNVLLAEDGTAKVSDFGMARLEFSEKAKTKFPLKWTAPEALRLQKFTSKSDVWSFGILLWEIYSFGKLPYPKIPMKSVISHIEEGYRMQKPDDTCPEQLYNIMQKTWNKDPSSRPSFFELFDILNAL